jgi:hypothetical protein
MALDVIQKDAESRDRLDSDRRRAIESARQWKRAEVHDSRMRHLREMEAAEQRRAASEATARRAQFERDQETLKSLHFAALRILAAEKERAEQNRQYLNQFKSEQNLRLAREARKIE